MITAQPTPNQSGAPKLHAGMRVPFFEKGGVTPLSAAAMAPIVALVNAFSNLQVVRKSATPNADGNTENSANFLLSDQNAIIELIDAISGTGTASSSVQLMQVVSDPGGSYITAKLCSATGGVFTVTGSALNVAKPFLIRGVAALDNAYTAGVHILATQPIGGTGVTVSSVDLVWEDLNADSRRDKASSGMHWKGLYSSGTTYDQYDWVYVTSGASQGTWLRIASGSAAGVDPVWPEAGTWKLIAFGALATDVCDGGSKTQYYNALPPA